MLFCVALLWRCILIEQGRAKTERLPSICCTSISTDRKSPATPHSFLVPGKAGDAVHFIHRVSRFYAACLTQSLHASIPQVEHLTHLMPHSRFAPPVVNEQG